MGRSKQVFASALVVLLLANLLFFAMGMVSNMYFWLIIVVCAIFAYWVMPRL